ncbi:FecR family protein [uncultured Chitinophaga sp.]|uniref:FecR family protein n=1 Tax=uncultured Chitinophaga sp. TaxID=339340 RepID=UPI002620EEA9|nr:FecR domain-containing protein [uncultured Chitinophaga sp.]
MNNEQKAYYEGLILRNYYNELSPVEQIELHSALQNYSQVRAIHNNLTQFLQKNRLPDKLEQQAVLAEYEKFEHKIDIQRVDRRLWMVAASVILLAGASIAFFLFRHIPGGDKVAPGPLAGVQLKLSDGSTQLLDKDIMIANNGFIKANKDTLTIIDHATGQGMNELIVPATYDYTLVLMDGSTVHLNADSKLRFANDNSNSQEVYLEGEAYFEVMPNAKRIFYVHYPGGTVKVLGTSFNVNTYTRGQPVTVLVAGKVDLIAQDSSHAQLTPGNAGIYVAGKWQIEPVDTMQALAWRQGIQYFDNAPLIDIIPTIQRWFNMKVELSAAAAEVKITTRINKHRPVTEFLDMLSTTSGLKYNQQENIISIHQ